jgi:hypothetical protein
MEMYNCYDWNTAIGFDDKFFVQALGN